MTPRNAETLYQLCSGLKLVMGEGQVAGVEARWFRPMDIGGTDGSHHSQTLRRLCALGWIEPTARHGLAGTRRHKLYRITLGGVRALANHQAQHGGGAHGRAAEINGVAEQEASGPSDPGESPGQGS